MSRGIIEGVPLLMIDQLGNRISTGTAHLDLESRQITLRLSDAVAEILGAYIKHDFVSSMILRAIIVPAVQRESD